MPEPSFARRLIMADPRTPPGTCYTLNQVEFDLIKKRLATDMPITNRTRFIRDLAAEFRIGERTVRKILNGELKRGRPPREEYDGVSYAFTQAEVNDLLRIKHEAGKRGVSLARRTQLARYYGCDRNTVDRVLNGQVKFGLRVRSRRSEKRKGCHVDYMHHPIDEPVES